MASFVFSQKIAKRGKPYTDGEYIKNCFINASEELFQYFKNKADILKGIKELPLSAKTIKDRTIKTCSNITTQYIEDLKSVSPLSIAVDESCGINDTAQVSLLVRFMSHSGSKEELLGLLPLKGQTRGEDIAISVIECMDKHHISLDKIVSISTDEAESMTGVRKGSQRKWSALNDLEKKHMIIFNAWSSIPDSYDQLKKLAFAVISLFGSTHICEQSFSSMNIIKSKLRSRLIDIEPIESLEMLRMVFGESTTANSNIYDWYRRFKEG
ncbi:SCAN domain-containing protein 3 [Trichonephila clavipes]|nr:SCAN domain-containing protein 3 [Trichonephila clavipes]